MKHALFADLHASEPGLSKLLAHPAFIDADSRICLGDVIDAPNLASAPEYYARVKKVSDIIILGNHEAALTGDCDVALFDPKVRSALRGAKDNIKANNPDFLNTLRALPKVHTLGPGQLTHASFEPANPWRHVRYTEDVQAMAPYMPTNLCFIAHGHIPFIAWVEGGFWYYERQIYGRTFPIDLRTKWAINVGSILGSREMRHYERTFVLYDEDTNMVSFINIEN